MNTEFAQQQTEERIAPPARVLHDVILRQGEEELERSTSALAWSGLASGLSMGASLIAEGLLHSMLPNESWRPVIAKFGYCVGFLIVIIGKQQLFTENTLTPVIPLMEHRDGRTLRNMLRLWITVLTANIAGTHLVSWLLTSTPIFRQEVRTAFLELAQHSMDPTWGEKVLRGILAGWLVALLVWMLGAVKSEGTAVIIILTYLIGIGGLTHVIAGSIEAESLMWAGRISWWDAFAGYTVPALIGNLAGGVALVAAVNHAQVKAERS